MPKNESHTTTTNILDIDENHKAYQGEHQSRTTNAYVTGEYKNVITGDKIDGSGLNQINGGINKGNMCFGHSCPKVLLLIL